MHHPMVTSSSEEPRRRRSRSLPALVLSAGMFAACAHDHAAPTAAEVRPPDISAYVSGEAERNLLPSGEFRLPAPQAPADLPIISEQRAKELAMAYARTFGLVFLPEWERDHGGRLRLDRFAPSPRVYFAETPYGRFPDDDLHPAARHGRGPFYLVTIEQAAVPVLRVAVSAYAAEMGITRSGMLSPPRMYGNEFASTVIPRSSNPFPTPEEAVASVGQRLQRRTVTVPRLLLRGYPVIPAEPLWSVSMDEEASVETRVGAHHHLVREISVGHRSTLWVPAAEQPAEMIMPAAVIRENGQRGGTRQIVVPILPGAATNYEEVVEKRR